MARLTASSVLSSTWETSQSISQHCGPDPCSAKEGVPNFLQVRICARFYDATLASWLSQHLLRVQSPCRWRPLRHQRVHSSGHCLLQFNWRVRRTSQPSEILNELPLLPYSTAKPDSHLFTNFYPYSDTLARMLIFTRYHIIYHLVPWGSTTTGFSAIGLLATQYSSHIRFTNLDMLLTWQQKLLQVRL